MRQMPQKTLDESEGQMKVYKCDKCGEVIKAPSCTLNIEFPGNHFYNKYMNEIGEHHYCYECTEEIVRDLELMPRDLMPIT